MSFGQRRKKKLKRKKFYPNNPIMAGAFAGFIAYAASNDDIVRDFEKRTGYVFPFKKGSQAKTVIERMIDEACGVTVPVTREQKEKIFEEWMKYLIRFHWGENPFTENA